MFGSVSTCRPFAFASLPLNAAMLGEFGERLFRHFPFQVFRV
jgi:hypothetical protein